MLRTVEDVIADVQSKARGRTRYEGQEPYPDEMLCAEIARLRAGVAAKEAAKWREVAKACLCVFCGMSNTEMHRNARKDVDLCVESLRALLGAGDGGRE